MANPTHKLLSLLCVLLIVASAPAVGSLAHHPTSSDGQSSSLLTAAGNDGSGDGQTTPTETPNGSTQTETTVTETPTETEVSTEQAPNESTPTPARTNETDTNETDDTNSNETDGDDTDTNETTPTPDNSTGSDEWTVVGSSEPNDISGDGRYGDVNGDGARTIVDTHALLVNLDSDAVQNHSEKFDFTGDGRVDEGDVQLLYRAVRGLPSGDRDGDGLPDDYERSVTGTDPAEPDTDGDGIVDGASDRDGDNLTAYEEYRIGTDPTSTDTDGDGLSDLQEDQLPGFDPTVADSDDDGVVDGREDPDGDGLDVLAERDNGTNHLVADTDNDGLSDGAEVLRYETDPTDPDTDGDGVSDGDEIRLGTDPLSPDSDGDGVSDANETYEVSTRVDNTTATVSVNGSAAIASGVRAQAVPQNTSESYRKSAVVHVVNRTAIENATVSFDVPADVPPSQYSNLTVLKWSPDKDAIWHPINTTVENGTASATVQDFSYFALVRGDEWFERVSIPKSIAGGEDDEEFVPVDASMVIDTSGSMGGGDLDDAKAASYEFLDALRDADQAALVGFESSATVHQTMTDDYDLVRSSIDSLSASGGTNIGDGIRAARDQHNANGADGHEQVLVVLSDGKASRSQAMAQAERAAEDGITIYSVAVGSGADESLLRDIAAETDGEYFSVDDSGDLTGTFRDISDSVKYADEDEGSGDGLPDAVETNGIYIPVGPDMGETVTTDPNEIDTDGDGLTDGEEVRLIDRDGRFGDAAARLVPDDASTDAWVAVATSNPTKVNSDNAGLGDKAEIENGSNPLIAERLLVGLEVPTRTDQHGNYETLSGHRGDRDIVFTGEYEWGSESCVVWGRLCSNSPPGWLTAGDNDRLENGKTYYQVPVRVRKSVQGTTADPAETVSINLAGNDDVRVLDGYVSDVGAEGTAHTIIIEAPGGHRGPSAGDFGVSTTYLGEFSLRFGIQYDSIFYRQNADTGETHCSSQGCLESVSATSPEYGLVSFSAHDATQLAEEGMETWRDATITAMDIRAGVYRIAYRGTGLTDNIGYKIIKNSRGQITDRIGSGEFDGDVLLINEGGEVHSYSTNAGFIQGDTIYFQFRGPAVIREN